MLRPDRYDGARRQCILQCYLFGLPNGILGGLVSRQSIYIMTVLNSEQITEPRIAPDFGSPYFAIVGWETRLSLKSPGGPPGSLGKNIPTLR